MGKQKENKDSIIDDVLKYVSDGNSLIDACSLNNVDRATFYRWMDKDEEICNRYARARELRAEKIFEEILRIADDGSNDFMTVQKGDLEYETENKEVINRSKLRVDARKWILSKMLPKKYGDKIEIDQNTNISGSVQITGMEII